MKKMIIFLTMMTTSLYCNESLIQEISQLEEQVQDQVDTVLEKQDALKPEMPESAQDLVDAFKSLRQTINKLKEAYCEVSDAICGDIAVKINILNEILKSLFESYESVEQVQ